MTKLVCPESNSESEAENSNGILPEGDYVLTLNRDQFETLYMITRAVGGDPKLSRRKHVTEIGKEISNHFDLNYDHRKVYVGTITFLGGSPEKHLNVI